MESVFPRRTCIKLSTTAGGASTSSPSCLACGVHSARLNTEIFNIPISVINRGSSRIMTIAFWWILLREIECRIEHSFALSACSASLSAFQYKRWASGPCNATWGTQIFWNLLVWTISTGIYAMFFPWTFTVDVFFIHPTIHVDRCPRIACMYNTCTPWTVVYFTCTCT